MKKLSALLILPLLISSCSNDKNHFTVTADSDETSYLADVQGCPKIHIRNKDKRLVQYESDKNLFEIQAVGYKGYCYFNEKTQKHKAVIEPQFKIIRLEPSDVNTVHFSYYLETAEGPTKYLGKKTFFTEARLPKDGSEMTLTEKKREIIIAEPGTYNLDVYFGLNAVTADSETRN